MRAGSGQGKAGQRPGCSGLPDGSMLPASGATAPGPIPLAAGDLIVGPPAYATDAPPCVGTTPKDFTNLSPWGLWGPDFRGRNGRSGGASESALPAFPA